MSSGPALAVAAQILIDEAIALLRKRESDPFTWRRCLRDLEVALPDAPFELYGSVYSAIGLCHNRLHQTLEALEAHRNAARWQPNDAGHQNNIACALISLGQPTDALEHLRHAHTMQNIPRRVETRLYVNEADAYRKLGEHTLAGRSFEIGARCVERGDAENLLNLAEIAANLGRENDCTELFARALEAAGDGERGHDEPAAEFVLAHGMRAVHDADAVVKDAILAVLTRWEGPTPEQYQERTHIKLDHEAWAKFCESAGLAPER